MHNSNSKILKQLELNQQQNPSKVKQFQVSELELNQQLGKFNSVSIGVSISFLQVSRQDAFKSSQTIEVLDLGVDQTVYSMVSKALYLYKMRFTRGITIYGVRETLLEFSGVCWSLLESVGVRVSCNLWLMHVMS